MESVLRYWDDLAAAHKDCDRRVPWEEIEDLKTVLQEFHSVLCPFREVQVLSQSAKTFTLLGAVLTMTEAYYSLARGNGNAVNMLWPEAKSRVFGGNDPSPRGEQRPGDRLDPRTRRVIKMLQDGLTRRYFYRSHPVLSLKKPRRLLSLTEANVKLTDFKESFLFEVALMFDPEM
jgi:hypothetical protein